MKKNEHVSSIDLMLLGLLRNQPMSPYELSKMQGIYEMVKISVPAIYKNVRRLEEDGYLKYKTVKEGKMPEKKIYSLTKKGENRFDELLNLCASSAINFFFDFSVSLLFVDSVSRTKGNEIINMVEDSLNEKKHYLEKQLNTFKQLPFPITNMAQQQVDLTKELGKWLKKFKEDYKG